MNWDICNSFTISCKACFNYPVLLHLFHESNWYMERHEFYCFYHGQLLFFWSSLVRNDYTGYIHEKFSSIWFEVLLAHNVQRVASWLLIFFIMLILLFTSCEPIPQSFKPYFTTIFIFLHSPSWCWVYLYGTSLHCVTYLDYIALLMSFLKMHPV